MPHVSSHLNTRWKGLNSFQRFMHNIYYFLICLSILWDAIQKLTCNQICRSWELTKQCVISKLYILVFSCLFKSKIMVWLSCFLNTNSSKMHMGKSLKLWITKTLADNFHYSRIQKLQSASFSLIFCFWVTTVKAHELSYIS